MLLLLLAVSLLFPFKFDVIITKDGNRLVGRIVRETKDKIVVRIHGGEVEISRDRIVKIVKEGEPLPLEEPEKKPIERPPAETDEPEEPTKSDERTESTDTKPPTEVSKEKEEEKEEPRYESKTAELEGVEFRWKQPSSSKVVIRKEYVRIVSSEDGISVDILSLPMPEEGFEQALKESEELFKEMRIGDVTSDTDLAEKEGDRTFCLETEDRILLVRLLDCGKRVLVVIGKSGVEGKQRERLVRLVSSVTVEKKEEER